MKKLKGENMWIIIAVAAAALLSLVTIAYAQENNNKSHMPDNNMMGGKGMDAMHKQMTKNLDPEIRNQMDKMHEQCEELHDDESFEEE